MSGPAAPVAAVRVAVRRTLHDLPPGTLVLVACSGGADSLALAAATAFVAPRAGWRAGAVVVDHALQAGSADVTARAEEQCRGLGLEPVVGVRVDVDPGAGGPEAAARAVRYAALERVAAATGASAVLLAHTRDDQAETVLLGLARGSGTRSLAGMAATRGLLRRPLLALDRATTRAACAASGLQSWDDPSNADPALARARVRTRVLPVLERELGPGVAAALARTAELAREDADALDALAAQALAACRVAVADGTGGAGGAGHTQRSGDTEGTGDTGAPPGTAVVLDAGALAGLLPAVRHRVLLAAARAAGAAGGSLTRGHALALDALVTAWAGQGPVALPGAVEAIRRCGRLRLAGGADRPTPARAPSEE